MDDEAVARGVSGTSRWSFGRRSVRSLASLLKRGGGANSVAKQQLATLSNDINLGNHCRADTRKPDRGETTDDPTAVASKSRGVRTTVLGCPRKLRASMPVRLPPTTEPVDAAASPLFQVKRHSAKRQRDQQPPQQCQLHPRLSGFHHGGPALASIPDEEEATSATPPPPSVLLELHRELRQVALVGWRSRLASPSDVWSLFASQWPVEVQALGPGWQVCALRPGTGRWDVLDSRQAPIQLPHGTHLRLEATPVDSGPSCRCSCGCTCSAAGVVADGSQQRIERLEAEVTSLSRRLQQVGSASVPATAAPSGRPPIDPQRLRHIRDECRRLRESGDAVRRDHDRRVRETRQMIADLANNVRRVLANVAVASPDAAESAEASQQRRLVEAELRAYQAERAEVSGLIEDIDETTGDLRQDVLRRRCRSNPAEVELLALHLSRATQRLATLKNRFPRVQARTRDLLRREAAMAASDERELAEEETRLDGWLRKVKKLTMMLFTFKQLAEAQAKEPPVPLPMPMVAAEPSPGDEVRQDLLRSVASVWPDHERRARAIERAELAIDRRRRMLREAAALKAEKTLTTAASRLKPVLAKGNCGAGGCGVEMAAKPAKIIALS